MGKYFFLLLIALFVIGFSGCAKETEGEALNNPPEVTFLSMGRTIDKVITAAEQQVFELNISSSGWVEFVLSVSEGQVQMLMEKQLSTAELIVTVDEVFSGKQKFLSYIGPDEIIKIKITALQDDAVYNLQTSPQLNNPVLPFSFRNYGCTACHTSSVDTIAPSWNSIANRYADNVDAETLLADKIVTGGSSNWAALTGGVIMPSYNGLIDTANIDALVKYILRNNGGNGLPLHTKLVDQLLADNTQYYEFAPRFDGVYRFIFSNIDTVPLDEFAVYDAMGNEIEAALDANAGNTNSLTVSLKGNDVYYLHVRSSLFSSFLLQVKMIVEIPENNEMPAIAKRSGCSACHAIDRKVVGPAWRDVAKHYQDDADAFDALVQKIKVGGRGNNWTEVTKGVPMPPYSPRVNDKTIDELVIFILSLDTSL